MCVHNLQQALICCTFVAVRTLLERVNWIAKPQDSQLLLVMVYPILVKA